MSEQDVDDGLTPWERTRRALHTAVDRICYAWPRARNDADARGYGTGRSYDGGGGSGGLSVVAAKARGDLPAIVDTIPATGVEKIALNPTKAVAWLAEFQEVMVKLCGPIKVWSVENVRTAGHEAVETMCSQWDRDAEHTTRLVIRLGSQGVAWWPPRTKKGDQVDGVTVGSRSTTLEICVFCQQPVSGGANDPIRRVGVDSDPVHKSPCWYALKMSRGEHPRQIAKIKETA